MRPVLYFGEWVPRLATRSDGKALLLVFFAGQGWVWTKHETWPRLRKPRAGQ